MAAGLDTQILDALVPIRVSEARECQANINAEMVSAENTVTVAPTKEEGTMARWNRRFSLVSVLAAAVFLVAGCSQSTPTPSAPEAPKAATSSGSSSAPQSAPSAAQPAAGAKDEIVVVQSADVANLDPIKSNITHVFNVAQNVLDTLTYLDRQMKVQPRLATSWKAIDDTTWEVKLRSGVKFHDGTPFDASVVKVSYDYETAQDSPSRAYFSNWASMEVVDPTTIRVKTKAPEPYFPNVLARVYVMAPSDLKDTTAFAKTMNGTGAYKLSEFVKGDHITLVANKDYWGGAPKIGKVVFRSAPEASARVAMLQSGQADVIVNVPMEQAKLLDSDSRLRVAAIAGLRTIPFFFDAKTPEFADVRVRQALNYAIDKESIIKNILGGYAVQQPGTISALMEGNNPDVKPYPYDPEKAKQLLAEAGYPNGFEMDLHYSSGRWMKDTEVAQAVAQMLGKVGVKAKLLTVEYSTYTTEWGKGQYRGISMIGTINPDGSPNVYNLFLHSKGAFPFFFTSPQLDSMIDDARTVLDPATRIKKLQAIEKYVHDNAAWIFLYDQKDLYGVNKALKWEPSPNEMMYFWDASF